MMEQEQTARIECQECDFTTLVPADDEEIPADVVIAHGKESGHKLSVTTIAE